MPPPSVWGSEMKTFRNPLAGQGWGCQKNPHWAGVAPPPSYEERMRPFSICGSGVLESGLPFFHV